MSEFVIDTNDNITLSDSIVAHSVLFDNDKTNDNIHIASISLKDRIFSIAFKL